MRQPIKNPSRVPAYQNPLKAGGFCSFQVASFPWGKALVGGMSLGSFSAPEKNKLLPYFCIKSHILTDAKSYTYELKVLYLLCDQ